MREVLFFNGLGLKWNASGKSSSGGWGGIAVPLAGSLDLLLMTDQAGVIL